MEQRNRSKLHSGGLLVFILTVGVFGIVDTEMGVAGILPLIAEILDVSVPQTSWTVSVFALVVAISAPVTPLSFLGIDRKRVMLLALGLFILSNIISMLTTNLTALLVARILPALLHPVYVSMAFIVTAASVSKEKAPKAASRVFVDVSAGMVLGIPVTNFIASGTSFSTLMLFPIVINALVLITTILFIPPMSVKEKVPYNARFNVLKRTVMWGFIITVTSINGATFDFFSYMSDYPETVAEVSYSMISVVLLVYGLASIVGNVLAGRPLSTNARCSIIIMPFTLLVFCIYLLITGEWITAMIITILILGVLASIASSNIQYMIAEAASETPDFANGMFLTSASLGITVSTVVCGAFIVEMGTHYSVFGTLFFLITSIIFVYLRVHVAHSQKRVEVNTAAG